ncbi:MAG: DUF3343 domain-containing protein [Ruminococcus sp.]|nr:DUF3343 domain-containing protein [Ruminococcus sp.]
MREKKQCVIVTFYTTAEAMATKKLCEKKKIAGKLISAPRSLSADCGIAWCSDVGLFETLKNALDDADIEVAGFHELMM